MTQIVKIVDSSVLLLPCLQVISNLITCPHELKMVIERLSTSIEMNFLEANGSLSAIGNNVAKKGEHKCGLSWCPLT
jgi:hypothetical protein